MPIFLLIAFVLLLSIVMNLFKPSYLNHMPNEKEILSSQKNMEYVYGKSRNKFDFHYSDIHIVKPDGNLMLLNDNVAIIGIDEIGSNEKKTLEKITYIEKNIDKYEEHHDISYCNQKDIKDIKHNIALTYSDINDNQIEKDTDFKQKNNSDINDNNEKKEILEILQKKMDTLNTK